MTPAASRRRRPGPDRPGPGLLGARGEEGLQAERAEPGLGQLGQAGLAQAGLGEQFGGLVLGQLGQVGFGLGVQEDRLGGSDQRRQALAQVGVAEFAHVAVEHVQERLGRQQLQLAQRSQIDARGGGAGRQGDPGVQELLGRLRGLGHPRSLGILGELGLLGQPGQGLLQRLQVGQDQLGDHRLYVALGRHVAVHVGRRRGRRTPAPPGRSRRSRGCGRGTGCRGPGPARRRGPGRRCR